MSDPGELVASGRAADVFRIAPDRVLRRYRTEMNCEPEGALMDHLRKVGFPVPIVHRAEGGDLEMEYVDGPTMVDDFARRPWRIASHIRTLARLQERLIALEAPDALEQAEEIPAGSSILHLDLHPMNVIMSAEGPVVIDWTNARRGAAGFDAAMTYVSAATFADGSRLERLGASAMAPMFRRFRGSDLIAAHLAAAIEYRLRDANLLPAERDGLERMRRRTTGGSA